MEVTKQAITDSLWVEKYRPTNLEDMAMDESYRAKFEQWIQEGIIPNILLVGCAGSGKTTLAKILMSKFDCDCSMMNASDERGIDVIRGKVKNFAQMSSFKKFKVMLMDEFDSVTPDAQKAMRATMEQYHKTTRFILTGNYANQIIDAIQSRCQTFVFNAYPKEEMKKILVKILTEEKMEYKDSDLDKHLNVYYPDLRKSINAMQQNIRSGKFVFKDKADLYSKILDNLLKKNIREVRQECANNAPEYADLYKHIYDNISLFPEKARLGVLVLAAEYLWRTGQIPDEEINFTAFCIKACQEIGK